ncbi:FIG006045: Sigma factor, ECF subfamily [plant metagenome]|uniref:FIG006045: Sigma factor, ECF subfamily n=1 Tax=plant metagenome TaxID=1297885 RepID=A0A484NT53_9ZZZZ
MASEYYQDLLRFCRRLTRDIDAARDAVQETYARFLALQQQGGQAVRQPGALLRRIARNLLVDEHRRANLRLHADLDGLAEEEQPMAPAASQPEQAACSSQAVTAYLDAIAALPPRCREAFLLHVLDGLPQAEIARRMGVSVSMVEKHLVRGMVACRACERRMGGRG